MICLFKLQELSGEPLVVEKEGQHVLIGERITDIGCGVDEDEDEVSIIVKLKQMVGKVFKGH